MSSKSVSISVDTSVNKSHKDNNRMVLDLSLNLCLENHNIFIGHLAYLCGDRSSLQVRMFTIIALNITGPFICSDHTKRRCLSDHFPVG